MKLRGRCAWNYCQWSESESWTVGLKSEAKMFVDSIKHYILTCDVIVEGKML